MTIIPQQPFIDWANNIDEDGPKWDETSIRATSILIPDEYDEFNYEEFLKKHFKEIFELELGSWMTAPDMWPKKRSYSMFMKWFLVVPSDIVIEMGKGPIRMEDL